MQHAYRHILTFYFKHRYFKDGLFRTIQISMADGTAGLLKNLELILKPFSGGFHLFSGRPESLQYADESDPIRLYLYTSDPNYVNYSELPGYNLAENLLFISNLNAYPDTDPGSFRLHPEQFAGQSEIVPISHGRIRIREFDAGKTYSFHDQRGIEFPAGQIVPSGKNDGEFSVSGPGEGLICVYENKQPAGKIFYKPQAVWRKPFAIAEIYPDVLFGHSGGDIKTEYFLGFNNRQTIWKYYLMGPVYQKFKKLRIINKGALQVFDPPYTETFQETVPVWVFVSRTTIPLTEVSDETFQLFDNYDPEKRSGEPIFASMPRATPNQLFLDTSHENQHAYSHIYI